MPSEYFLILSTVVCSGDQVRRKISTRKSLVTLTPSSFLITLIIECIGSVSIPNTYPEAAKS